MALYRILDDNVISEAEYRANQREIVQFLDARAAGRVVNSFALSGGRSLIATTLVPPGTFSPIGRGLPLQVMIQDVYTGKYPESGVFAPGDVAVVSGVKNYDVFNASTRALNFVAKKQPSHSHLKGSAFNDGSALVAYSPAIITDSLIVSAELAVASFPQDLIDTISTAFNTAAGIPLLLPYSGFLLGAGHLIKLIGDAGQALFDGPRFSVTASVDFDVPGSPPATADFRILVNDTFHLTGFRYQPGNGLVDAHGNKYTGDEPYIVISLDGKARDDLKKFAPTVASAAILQRFFQVRDGAQVVIEDVVHGIQLASDLKYRQQALNLKARLDAAPPADKPAIQKDYDAAVANISEDALKPK